MRELIWQERREFLTPEQRKVLGNLSPFTEFVIHTYLDQCNAPTMVEEIYHRVSIKRYTDKMIREGVSPQDPAPHSNRDITMDDIHRIAEEMFEEEGTDEEKAYRKGYMDGYDEGLYDRQHK